MTAPTQAPSNLLSIEERAIVEQLALSGWVIREEDPGGYCEQNIFYLDNRGTTLRVDQVRKLQGKGLLVAFNGGYRLSDAGRALVEQPSHEPPVDWDAALKEFTAYFVRNYPGQNTIISDPTWHAPKIFRAAKHAIKSASKSPQGECPTGDYERVGVVAPKGNASESPASSTPSATLRRRESPSDHRKL